MGSRRVVGGGDIIIKCPSASGSVGTAGGDFRFRLNVLVGDADRNGTVNAPALTDIKRRLNRSITDPGTGTGAYSVFADLTGDGRVNSLDLAGAKQRLNQRLPTGEPAAM